MSDLTLCVLEISSTCTFANSEHSHEGSLTDQKEKHRPNDNRGHLLSGSILNHLMHSNHLMYSKDVECILMFLSAMPKDVSVAHIYALGLPV